MNSMDTEGFVDGNSLKAVEKGAVALEKSGLAVNPFGKLEHLHQDTAHGADIFKNLGHESETEIKNAEAKTIRKESGTAGEIVEAPAPQDKAIARADKVASIGDKIWSTEFFGGMAASMVGGAALKVNKKLGTGIKIIGAPFEALHKTSITAPRRYRENLVKSAQRIAKESDVATWEESLGKTAARLETANNQYAEKMAPKITSFFAPLTQRIKSALTNFAQTGAGGKVEGWLQSFSNWRASSATKTHWKHLGKAQVKLTDNHVAWWRKVTNFFTRTKPAKHVELHSSLQSVHSRLKMAEGATGAELVGHMEAVKTELTQLSASADTELASRAGRILSSVEKSGEAASVAHAFGTAEKQGLVDIVKTAGKSLGKMSLFAGIIVASTGAMVTSTLLKSKKDTNQTTQAFDEIVTDLEGGRDNPLFKNIEQEFKHHKHRHHLGTAASLVGDVGNGALMMHSAGGFGVMVAPMIGGMVGSVFASPSPKLNAYVNLKRAEQGKLTLTNEQKRNFISNLMVFVDAIDANGKERSILGRELAQEFLAEGLSVKEILNICGNNTKFTARAEKGLAKIDAAKEVDAVKSKDATSSLTKEALGQEKAIQTEQKELHAAHDKPATAVANDNQAPTALKAPMTAEERYLATERPASLLELNQEPEHEGKVALAQALTNSKR